MRFAALAVLALAASCAKCGAPHVVDAGPPLQRRSTDLRTAVLTAFPEFRETKVVQGSAVLRRTLVGDPSGLEAAARETFKANGYVEEPGAPGARTLAATKDIFRLEVELKPAGAELRLSLPVKDGDAARLLGAPISMTTEQLALYFPRAPDLVVARERFEVTLEYVTENKRAHFLVWQLVDLNTRAGWKLAQVPEGFEVPRGDAGAIGAVPERVSLLMEDPGSGARVMVDRDGPKVRLEYQLDTLAPAER